MLYSSILYASILDLFLCSSILEFVFSVRYPYLCILDYSVLCVECGLGTKKNTGGAWCHSWIFGCCFGSGWCLFESCGAGRAVRVSALGALLVARREVVGATGGVLF